MKKIGFLFGLLIFVMLGGRAEAANLSFTATGSYEERCSATINVLLDTQGQEAGAVDAIMKFNPAQVTVSSVLPGTLFRTYLDPVIDSTNGVIKLTAYGRGFTGQGTFARVVFRSRAGVGSTTFSWDFTLDSTIDSNVADRFTSADILTFVRDGNYSFYPTDGYCTNDTAGPTVDNQIPRPGSINQPLDTDIAFRINDNRSGVDINSVVVTVTNDGKANQYRLADFNYNLVLVSSSGEPRSYEINFVPVEEFVERKPVFIEVVASDRDGNVGRASWSFNHPEPTCEELGCTGGACDDFLSIWASPGNHQIQLEWFPKPEDMDYEKVVIRRLTCSEEDNFPKTPSDGTLVYDGPETSMIDGGLENDISYCYSAFAYRENDSAVEYSPAAFLKSTPNCYISSVSNFIIGKFDNGIQLNWQNPKFGSFDGVKVIRQEGGCPSSFCYDGCWAGNQTVYDGTDQSFFDADIKPETNYCYLVFAYNQDGCSSSGALGTTGDFAWDKYPTTTDQFAPSVRYYTNNGGLEISAAAGTVSILRGKDLIFDIKNDFEKEVERIVAELDGKLYMFALSEGGDYYRLPFDAWETAGDYQIAFKVVYSDGTVYSNPVNIKVVSSGRVISKVLGVAREIEGVKVFLYDNEGKIFVGVNQKNPLTTDERGEYGLMVPNGQYRLVVRDGDQEKYSSAIFRVGDNIVNQEINLASAEGISGKVAELAKNIFDNPALEDSNIKYFAPTALAVTGANAAVSIPWWNFINYVRYLFTEPFAWIFRRRRRGWGVVYNSITKKPIDLAVVRLYNYETKKLIRSQVTDKNGRYSFLVDEGKYYIEIERKGYVFPSQILSNVSEDLQYTDIYHGEVIRVGQQEMGAITANIPIDQEEAKVSNSKLIRQNFWKNVREDISAIGPIFAILSFAVTPSILIGSFAIVHIILFLMFRRLAKRQKPKSWGVVYDMESREPLKNAVARIFSPQYNRMLEVQVTDKYGRYGFLVENNSYFVTASKEGYKDSKTDVIDLTNKKANDVFGFDLWLKAFLSGKSDGDLKLEQVQEKEGDKVLEQPVRNDNLAPTGKIDATVSESVTDSVVTPPKPSFVFMDSATKTGEHLADHSQDTVSETPISPENEEETKFG